MPPLASVWIIPDTEYLHHTHPVAFVKRCGRSMSCVEHEEKVDLSNKTAFHAVDIFEACLKGIPLPPEIRRKLSSLSRQESREKMDHYQECAVALDREFIGKQYTRQGMFDLLPLHFG
jgi:hypothetical protein